MSSRSAVARSGASLQPEYVRRDTATRAGGRDPVFRFSVPVLRVADITATIAWYRGILGFAAESFPERAPHECAILERDGVQILVRQQKGPSRRKPDGHSGWDLYIWVDGLDLEDLETTMALSGDIVRPLSPMGTSMAELEVRDPDGYVLCIGGPTPATAAIAQN